MSAGTHRDSPRALAALSRRRGSYYRTQGGPDAADANDRDSFTAKRNSCERVGECQRMQGVVRKTFRRRDFYFFWGWRVVQKPLQRDNVDR